MAASPTLPASSCRQSTQQTADLRAQEGDAAPGGDDISPQLQVPVGAPLWC